MLEVITMDVTCNKWMALYLIVKGNSLLYSYQFLIANDFKCNIIIFNNIGIDNSNLNYSSV